MFANIVRFDFYKRKIQFRKMKKIEQETGAVYAGECGWEALDTIIVKNNFSKIFVLTDTLTNKLCLPYFLNKTKNTLKSPIILKINDGEENKNIATCLNLWETLSENNADRKSLLINLGGGVVTDLGGFVACTFKRGIEFINVPTTLLAMVDASVGGKNGVDLGVLKNQIGIIQNAKCVIVDEEFLKTLSDIEINSGAAEMYKHGLIASEEYWDALAPFNYSESKDITELIWQSILIKNEVVTEDPTEQGLRKTLNFGHTLGHAIESYCIKNEGRKRLLHGEAIIIGMILAAYISSEITGFSKNELKKITSILLLKYKKVRFEISEISEIIDLLVYDKKNSHGKINFVLLNSIGDCSIDRQVENQLILDSFDYYKNFGKL